MLRSQQQGSRSPLTIAPIETPEGVFVAHFSELGLARLNFPKDGPAPLPSEGFALPEASSPIHEWIPQTRENVLRVLLGQALAVLPPLDLRSGTAFQRRVWSELQNIACGKTRSYSDIAVAIGNPKATRAVGGACGANPIPLLIPCHRVLASGNKPGGFSGGMAWKQRLLTVEGTWPKSLPEDTIVSTRQNSFCFEG